MSPDTLSVVVRSVSFVLIFQAVGAAFFLALFSRVQRSGATVRRLMGVSALSGVIVTLLHLVLETTRMSGDFAGLFDLPMYKLLLHSATGASHATQALGLLLVGMAATGTGQHDDVVSSLGGAIAISGFLLVGHTSVHPWHVLLALLLTIHLLIIAFWFGSLLPLWIVLRSESPRMTVTVLQEFSSLATWLVPIIAIAGAAMTLLIAGGLPPLHEPYGELILVKVAGFVLLMGFAIWNKWRLVPAVAMNGVNSVGTFRRSLVIELVLIVGVLSVTAVMTALFSPNE